VRRYRSVLKSLSQPGWWLRLLRRVARPWQAGRSPEASAVAAAHPLPEDLRGNLQRIAAADRQLTFFFARSDPAQRSLTLHAKREVKRLQRAGKLSLHFIEDADHSFTRRAHRLQLIAAIVDHLQRRYVGAATRPT
jgi:hypothetical protein